MNLTLEGIKKREDWEKAGIALPSYDVKKIVQKTKKGPVWVHFGVGNIFRIFLGGIADCLLTQGEMDKGITCVEAFDYDVVDKIYQPYDNLVLAVTLKADGKMKKQVFGSISEAIQARVEDESQWRRLREIFADEGLQMVSFTITEKGYVLKNGEGEYLPFIQEDMEGGPKKPGSVMAVVCSLLHHRYRNGKAPLALVSMDNCSHNGEKLKAAVTEMAKQWLKRGLVEEGFLIYLQDETQVSFPWSMIDKITPRPAESVYVELKDAGVQDMKPVVTSGNTYIAPFVNAEAPQYLVIEDNFPNGRVPLEKAGVYMTDRETVNLVERMKVTTCLNPLHTALAVYGCLLGYEKISDEMEDDLLKRLVVAIGPVEGMPVVTHPGILSPKEFVEEVIEVRLCNPFLPDSPQRIATDTSQKVGIRYGETIKAYVQRYGDARKLTAIPLAIAGWCRYLLGVDDAGRRFQLSPDPMLEELKESLSGIEVGNPRTYRGQLRRILSNETLFGIDLYRAGIGERIEEMFLEEMNAEGAVRRTLEKYL